LETSHTTGATNSITGPTKLIATLETAAKWTTHSATKGATKTTAKWTTHSATKGATKTTAKWTTHSTTLESTTELTTHSTAEWATKTTSESTTEWTAKTTLEPAKLLHGLKAGSTVHPASVRI
jgi:hypothetical protein